MQRKKLTDADKAKRDAKRAKRAAAEPTAQASGPTLGSLIARDGLVRTAAKSTRGLITSATEYIEDKARTHLGVISCHTCTAPKGCCKLTVALLFHEVLPIADRLRREGRDTPEMRAQLAESADLMESRSTQHYRDLMRPCVFLDAAERCTVYQERPRDCGAAFVFSPPADCSDPTAAEVETVQPPMDPVREQLWATEKLVEQSLGLVRLKGPYMGVLPRMVLLWLEAWDRTDFADYLAEHVLVAGQRMVAATSAR
jgi:Fe-S-cluster containining protein